MPPLQLAHKPLEALRRVVPGVVSQHILFACLAQFAAQVGVRVEHSGNLTEFGERGDVESAVGGDRVMQGHLALAVHQHRHAKSGKS